MPLDYAGASSSPGVSRTGVASVLWLLAALAAIGWRLIFPQTAGTITPLQIFVLVFLALSSASGLVASFTRRRLWWLGLIALALCTPLLLVVLHLTLWPPVYYK